MKITGNTILIVGGTAGIGLELAKLLAVNGNQLIITGRNETRLKDALRQLVNTVGFVSDTSKKEDVEQLVSKLKLDYPSLNMVINNAGNAHLYNLATGTNIMNLAADEMLTNYLSVIRINELLLPLLSAHDQAAIVNVSSVVAFVPGRVATYSASKAALHSYTQSLRFSLSETSVKVFELMPPLVNTEFSRQIGGANGISPQVVAAEFLAALELDNYEIRVGNTQLIYDLYLKSPGEAFAAMNPR